MISKKILLVGGCGFIGHNLAIYLKKIGNNPIIVDSLQINNLYAKPDDEITNKHLYDSILKTSKYDKDLHEYVDYGIIPDGLLFNCKDQSDVLKVYII